jgi:sporulation protein YtfJ
MENHPIETLMTSTMENLRDMIDVNTIIGEPIESKDGTLILPISKVSFGFASGGSEFSKESEAEKKEDKYPFGGGSGAGVSVKPVAFLVIRQDSVRLLSVGCHSPYDKMLDNIPPIIEMIKDSLGKHNENKKDLSTEEQKS